MKLRRESIGEYNVDNALTIEQFKLQMFSSAKFSHL